MNDDNPPNLSDAELREIKTQYNKAKSILENINALSIRYDAAFKALETRTIDFEKAASDIRERSSLIESAKTESSNLLSQIRENLEKIQGSITQIEDSIGKAEGVKGRIEGKEGEVTALVVSAKSLRDDIEQAKLNANNKLVEIDAQFGQVQDKIKQIQNAYEGFLEIRSKVNDSKTGLEAILNQSIDLQKQTNTAFAEIKSYQEQSKAYLDQIVSNSEASESIRDAAEQSLNDINSKKAEVEKITALIADTGLANAFQRRERMLRVSAIVWLIILIASVVGLAVLLYKLFHGVEGVPEIAFVLYRLTLTSPLLLLIGIAARQYSNERTLNEKYAFKATIAAVIKSHAEFLIEIREKDGAETSAFMREALGGVYVEPYKSDVSLKDAKQQLNEILEERESGERNHIASILDNAKKLKDLIHDDETFKTVIEFFAKLK